MTSKKKQKINLWHFFINAILRGKIVPVAKQVFLLEQTEKLKTAPYKTFRRIPQKLFSPAPDPVVKNDLWPLDRPLVSVIIPCYNYGRFVKEAVDSVLSQSLQDIEIIVVEGGSTDQETVGVVRSLEGGKVRCLYQPKRCSVGENRLTGLKEARGKYIVFLDADDKLESSYLEKAFFVLETRGYDVLTPHVKLFGSEDALKAALKGNKKDTWQTEGMSLSLILETNSCSTVSMFRYSFWKENEIGYSTDPEYHIEDWDFWIRMASKGARFYVLPQALHLYRVHGSSITDSLLSQYPKYMSVVRETWKSFKHSQKLVYPAIRRQHQIPIVENPEINLYRNTKTRQFSHDDKMKVLLCIPWMDMGGNSVLMKEIFSQLRSNVEVVAVSTVPSRETYTSNGLHLYQEFAKECILIDDFGSLELAKSFLIYLARQRAADLVLIVGSTLAYESLPVLRQNLPQVKVVDQLYNPIGHVGSNKKYRKWIDFNVVASQEVEAKLLEMGEVAERIKIIPHGVDDEKFHPKNRKSKYVEIRDPKVFRFGFLGRLSEEKRPLDMVELARRFPNAEILVGGVGPLDEEMKEEIIEGDLGNIRMIGFVESPYQVYSNIDALVLPSRIEGLPITLLESMSLEIPVIAAEVGEIGHVIRNGMNGFVYPSGDLGALERCAMQLIQASVEERERIGISARQAILQGFTIRQCSENYLDTFLKVLET